MNVTFPSEKVHIEGLLGDYASTAASGNLTHRGFCPSCGTPVTTQSEARPHFRAVRAGTLDDPEIGKPKLTIWTLSAPSWACFAEDLPQEANQPRPSAIKAVDQLRVANEPVGQGHVNWIYPWYCSSEC